MMVTELNLNNITIGDLVEHLSKLPKDLKIDIYNTGNTGVIGEVTIEIDSYDVGEPSVYLNIEADSGFY